MKNRMSKLQKIILSVLQAKDVIDWDTFYKICRPNLKAPYWHTLRDMYNEPVNGDTVGRVIEVGVRNSVEKLFPCFSASFSRSIKGLLNKNLVEVRYTDKNTQVSEIRLKVNIHKSDINNKTQDVRTAVQTTSVLTGTFVPVSDVSTVVKTTDVSNALEGTV